MALTVKDIWSLIEAGEPGVWTQGEVPGLQFIISPNASRKPSFAYRYLLGKRRTITLPVAKMPETARELGEIVDMANEYRKLVKAGIDPLARREQEQESKQPKKPLKVETFKQVATEYIENNWNSWKNEKHRQQWQNTLTTYAFPKIGKKAPYEITTQDVLDILTPIWTTKRETAARVRSRIEKIISAAKAKGVHDDATKHLWLNHSNPARYEDNLEFWLNGKKNVKHHSAMPFDQCPEFARELRGQTDISAKALLWTILTAVRTGETIGATWDEIDL